MDFIDASFVTAKHPATAECPRAQHDDLIAEMIDELSKAADAVPTTWRSQYKEAKLLAKQFEKIKAFKLMQYFPEFDRRLSEQETKELTKKIERLPEYDCSVCNTNLFALSMALPVTLMCLEENVNMADPSQTHKDKVNQVREEFRAFVDRAIYISSRANEIIQTP